MPDFNSSNSGENVEIQHDIAPKDSELQCFLANSGPIRTRE